MLILSESQKLSQSVLLQQFIIKVPVAWVSLICWQTAACRRGYMGTTKDGLNLLLALLKHFFISLSNVASITALRKSHLMAKRYFGTSWMKISTLAKPIDKLALLNWQGKGSLVAGLLSSTRSYYTGLNCTLHPNIFQYKISYSLVSWDPLYVFLKILCLTG